jgi:hypothetical protein
MIKEVISAAAKLRNLWRFGLFLYLVKAVLALIIILPFFMVVNARLASSNFSYSVLYRWDMSIIVELFKTSPEIAPPLFLFGIIGGLIYLLIVQFLNGGLYYLMLSGKTDKIDWRQFFAECGAGFGIHLRIMLLMMLVYLLLFVSGVIFVNMIGELIAGVVGGDLIFITGFKLAILLLIFMAASLFSDSARAAAAVRPESPLKKILKSAAEFFRPRLIVLSGIFLLTYIPFLVVWLFSEWTGVKVNMLITGLIGVILEFLFFQLSSVARTFQKLWYLILMGKRFRSVDPGRFTPEQIELKFGSIGN